jgi:hypothetical protein
MSREHIPFAGHAIEALLYWHVVGEEGKDRKIIMNKRNFITAN